jgi:hypothetical protein
VRTEGERVLVTLGFRDEGASYTQKVLGMGPNAPARTVLLLLDGRTYALQAVRELVGDTAQTTARDLWRVDGEEMVPTVPAALPPVQGEAAVADDIIDPACPGLARDAVVSLRGLAMLPYPYGGLPIPTPLPANVVQAVLIDSVPEDTGAFVDVYNAQLVLRSADGWLQIRNSGYVENTPATSVVERGAWVVLFRDAEYSSVPLAAVVWQKDQQDPSMIYSGQSFEIEASGWTRDQVLDVVERLQPLDERTWPTLAPQFLDPHPLPADVQQVLVGAQQALATLPNGMLHVTMEATARTGRRQGERLDPYHVPSNITAPNAWTVEQWATINNTAPVQFKQIAMAWDGTLLSANVDTVAQSSWYEVRLQSADPSSENAFSPYGYGQATFGIDLARPLLALNAPITLTADGDLWRVEQILPTTVSDVFIHGYWAQLIGNSALASVSPVDDLPLGDLVQRVSFDRAQLLPRRWELVRRTEGGEMVLQSIAVREWRRLDAPLPDGFWALPPLPDDTVLYTFDQSSAPLTGINGLDVPQPRAVPSTIDTVGGPIPITPPQRALVWPQESGFTIERNYPYRSPVTISSQWEGASFGDLLLYGSNGTGLPETGIVRSTRYELPDSTRIVTLTQGPRALLRYLLLRTGGFFGSRYGYEEPPQQSEQVQVTIAGEQHDAWLLRGPRNAALVVEIDDVLVHFTGSADYVGGVMLEQLPALEWEPVVLGQGDGGGAIEVQP